MTTLLTSTNDAYPRTMASAVEVRPPALTPTQLMNPSSAISATRQAPGPRTPRVRIGPAPWRSRRSPPRARGRQWPCAASGRASERNVPVLALRDVLALVPEHLQRAAELRAGVL